MARLAAVERGLYYPTDDPVVRQIAKLVRPQGAKRILDPCAGEGRAVAALAKAWRLDPFGVELDVGRAATARGQGVRCLQGSVHSLEADAESFGVLFLNPPYDHGQDDDGRSLRQEVEFLRTASRWLASGGLLVFVVSEPVLRTSPLRDVLRTFYRGVEVYRFPKPHYARFRQCVVFATKAKVGMFYGHLPDVDADIPTLGTKAYSHTAVCESALRLFDVTGPSPEEAAPRYGEAATGCYDLPQWRALVDAGARYDLRPLLPLRPGHRALLLAAGCLDGAELRPGVLVKGSSEKIETEREDHDAGKAYRTERIVSRISTLDLATGELDQIRVDEAPELAAAWFEEHKEALADTVAGAYPAAFPGDLDAFDFSGLQAPGVLPGRTEPELLDVQRQTAAAVAWWWRSGHKSAVVSGEMGTGKTTMGTCAAELFGARKVVVMCPGHLVSKWVRETGVVAGHKALTARRQTEVDRFFEDPEARFLVLSKDQAKLGARWRPAYLRRRVRVTFEVPEYEEDRWGRRFPTGRKKLIRQWKDARTCPGCGAVLSFSEEELEKTKSTCECGEALWQATAISAKGTKRWPLARYINRRYAGRYALLLDECHQYAGADTDQSRAATHLVAGATKLLAMTGTLYGGRASSIFHLLYKVDPEFRRLYAFNACREFVQHHGLFETILDLEEATSVFGVRRNNAGGRVREIPGASPSMIKLLLNYTAFVRLPDLGVELPPYHEEVELVDLDEEVLAAVQDMTAQCLSILREHPRVLGQYLQAVLGYPDRPDQAEEIVDIDLYGNRGDVLATAPALPDRPCPKDDRLVEIVREERAAGRGVLVYFAQTKRRDARGRVRERLERAGFKVAVLEAGVSPGKREEWVAKAMRGGTDVLLTNGRLVETGLDLLWAHTIVQYGVEYSVRSLRQSTRRSWRLGQTKPVRVVYMAYRGTAQEAALNLIAKKMRAAELLDGEEAGGLAQHDTEGHDFFLELAREIVADRPTARSRGRRAVLRITPEIARELAIAGGR